MSFFERAKAAASDLAAKADTAMQQHGMMPPALAGDGDRLLKDLGIVTFLESSGREVPAGERERILGELRRLDQEGKLTLVLGSASGQGGAPPPPGGAGAPPPPPGASGGSTGAGPSTGEGASGEGATPEPPTTGGGTTPPPPPPNWS